MARLESLDIAGPAGRLEAVLMTPGRNPVAAGVICHAHPLHGGTMHFKVVFRAAKTLRRHGLAALRFNFRGVGRSQGTHDGGRGEQEDARAALDLLEDRYPGRPLLLGGFSFGSVVAIRVGADRPRVRAVLALGFPADTLADLSFVSECRKPLCFIQGEQDAFGRPETLRGIAAPGSVVVIPRADHFFAGQLTGLEAALDRWLASRPWLDSRPRSR